MKFYRPLLALALLFNSTAFAHSGKPGQFIQLLQDPEARMLDVSEHLYQGEFDPAEKELVQLISDNPDFLLAHLVYAEVMKSKSGLVPGFKDWQQPDSEILAGLIDEARQRNAHRSEAADYAAGKLPDFLLQLSPTQKQVIIVDSGLSRAHVFKNIDGQLSLAGDYYITVGKNGVLKAVEGDGRTPTGVYFITSRLNPLGLDDLYGDGALPLNYPNEWDQRLGRTGFGIWLHGVPSDTYNRAPFATQGCVAFPNDDISLLYNTPEIQNSPVIITRQVNWATKSSILEQRNSLAAQIENWRNSWASGEMQAVAQYYADTFRSGSQTKQSWLSNINTASPLIGSNSFQVSDLSLFKYPGEQDLVVATFNKEFLSDVASERRQMRQYWKMSPLGDWRIVYEGPAEYQAVHFKGIPRAVMPSIAEQLGHQSNAGGS